MSQQTKVLRRSKTQVRNAQRRGVLWIRQQGLGDRTQVPFCRQRQRRREEATKETGWCRTDFVWVPEDTTIRPTRGSVATKRGREDVSDINTDQETERVSKKQVLSRLASFCQSQLAYHASRLSCKQSLRNTGDWHGHKHTKRCSVGRSAVLSGLLPAWSL